MKHKSLMILGAWAFAAVAGSASAGPITYVGDYGPNLSLTLTTNGAMGPIVATDITSFSVRSDVLPDGGFDSSDGLVLFLDTSFEGTGTAVTASPSGLGYDFTNDPYNVYFQGESATNQDDRLFITVGVNNIGSGLYVDGSTDFNGGVLIPESGTAIFATPVATAPEPATWALMVAGLAGVGLGLRRVRERGSRTLMSAAT